LNELVRACLAKQPDLRIQDFGLLRGRLALLYHQLTGETLDPPTKASSSRSVTLADQGANLLELGSKYDDVMPLFEEALRLEPSNDYLWLRKGLAIAVYSSTTADLMQDALLCFETALKLNPNNTKAWLQKGHALASLGRHQHSLECYNAVLRLQPRDRAAYAGKGWRLAALGQKKEALAHFEAALRLDPRDREFASYLCVLRGASTTKNDGMDLFRQTVYQAYISPRTTVAPSQKNGETNLKSVRVCLKQQEEGFLPERIEGSFEQFFQQGLQAISAKQFEEALACFGRALEINPSSEIACNSRGRLLDALGSHEEALACFERLLAMSPRLDKAWYGMASALRNLGRHDAALDCYDHALQINPLYADAAFGKGQAAQNLRRFHQALSFYDRTTEIDARFQQAWAAKGVCMAMLNRHREALRSFEKALELDPREGTTWFHKGLLLLNALRNYPEALICFEQAKSLGNPQADHGIWLTKQMLDTKQ
jgi:tetratricopeptide (TPR) repeat protein